VINLEVAEVVETEVLVEVLDQADLVEISQATEEVVAVEMPTVQVELELQSDQPEIEEQAVEIQVADQPGKVHQDLVLASQELAELEKLLHRADVLAYTSPGGIEVLDASHPSWEDFERKIIKKILKHNIMRFFCFLKIQSSLSSKKYLGMCYRDS